MTRLTEDVRKKGYFYIDWNVTSGDVGPNSNNPKILLENIENGSKNKDFIIVLFHDTKNNIATANILPDVIRYYKENGYN